MKLTRQPGRDSRRLGRCALRRAAVDIHLVCLSSAPPPPGELGQPWASRPGLPPWVSQRDWWTPGNLLTDFHHNLRWVMLKRSPRFSGAPVARISAAALVDIFLVTCVFYVVLNLIEGRRAYQMTFGTLIVGGLLLVTGSSELGLTTVQWIVRSTLPYLGIALIVLYQAEIRTGLARIGGVALCSAAGGATRRPNAPRSPRSGDAAAELSHRRIGAIVAWQGSIGPESYIDTGVPVDARLSAPVLVSLFQPSAPLHDGAVIVNGDRIVAARCVAAALAPGSARPERPGHPPPRRPRAERGDRRTVLVVSEETGRASVAHRGRVVPITSRADFDVEIARTRPPAEAVERRRPGAVAADGPMSDAANRSPRARRARARTHRVYARGAAFGCSSGSTTKPRSSRAPLSNSATCRRASRSSRSVPGAGGRRTAARRRRTAARRSGRGPSRFRRSGGEEPGERIWFLGVESVEAPRRVQVMRVDPSQLVLSLERTFTGTVRLNPRVLGEPAAGYEIYRILIDPPQLDLEGPESRVADLEQLTTEPISAQGLRETYARRLQLEVDPALRPEVRRVEVRLVIGEEREPLDMALAVRGVAATPRVPNALWTPPWSRPRFGFPRESRRRLRATPSSPKCSAPDSPMARTRSRPGSDSPIPRSPTSAWSVSTPRRCRSRRETRTRRLRPNHRHGVPLAPPPESGRESVHERDASRNGPRVLRVHLHRRRSGALRADVRVPGLQDPHRIHGGKPAHRRSPAVNKMLYHEAGLGSIRRAAWSAATSWSSSSPSSPSATSSSAWWGFPARPSRSEASG